MFSRETIMFLLDLGVRGLAIVVFTVGLYLVRKYNLEKWVTIAVNAAESLYNMPGMGAEKKKWVSEFISQKLKYSISAEELEALVEAAVTELNKFKK